MTASTQSLPHVPSRPSNGKHSLRGTSRKRTLHDQIISTFNSIRFALLEPVLLRLARASRASEYAAKEKEPLISVVIPTFNRAQILLERGVPTVLSQTHQNLELIIIGNTCTDDTAERLSRIHDPRLTFYNLPPRKLRHPDDPETRWLVGGLEPTNEGIRRARGQWVAWLGDDDLWTPNHLEKLLLAAQGGDFEFVSAQYEEERFGEKKIVDGERANSGYHTRRPSPANDDSPRIGGIQTWLFRSYLRFFKLNIHCWRKSWNRPVDADVYLRMYNAGVRMGYLDEIVAFVLPRPGEETIGLDAYLIAGRESPTLPKVVPGC